MINLIMPGIKIDHYPKTTGACTVAAAMGITAIAIASSIGFKKAWTKLVDSEPSHYIALTLMLVVAPALVGGMSIGIHQLKDYLRSQCYPHTPISVSSGGMLGIYDDGSVSCFDKIKGCFTGAVYHTF